ncbi:MAG: hypothetical protein ACLTDF_06075 [Coprococcus sp.]
MMTSEDENQAQSALGYYHYFSAVDIYRMNVSTISIVGDVMTVDFGFQGQKRYCRSIR